MKTRAPTRTASDPEPPTKRLDTQLDPTEESETVPADLLAEGMAVPLDANMMSLLDQVSDKAAEKAAATALEGLDDRLDKLLTKHAAETDKKLELLEKKWEARLLTMEKQVAEATSAAASAVSAASAASVAGSAASVGLGSAWAAERVEVKGYIDDWSKLETEGLPRRDIPPWLEKLRQAMMTDADLRIDMEELVCWDTTSRRNRLPRQGVVHIYMRQEARSCEDSPARLRALVAAALRVDVSLSGPRTLRVVSQLSPDKLPVFRQAGQMLGLMRQWHVQVMTLWP